MIGLIFLTILEQTSSIVDFLAAGAAASECAASFPILWAALQESHARREDHGRKFIEFKCDPMKGACGGWGDRTSGMLSVVMYGLAANRSIIINEPVSAEAFDLPGGSLLNINIRNGQYYAKPIACMNVGSCRELEQDHEHDVLLVQANRAWVCLWAHGRGTRWITTKLKALGVDSTTDLWHLAGCMLRGVLVPKRQIVDAVHKIMQPSLRWIAMHFRTYQLDALSKKETRTFMIPECADKQVRGPGFAALILSDDTKAALGIRSALQRNWSEQLVQPISNGSACHVDIPSKKFSCAKTPCHIVKFPIATSCLRSTALEWLAMASSDVIVLQARYGQCESTGCPGMASGFSQTASIYGLRRQPHILATKSHECIRANSSGAGNHASGNWVCY